MGWFPTSTWNAVWNSGTDSPACRKEYVNVIREQKKIKQNRVDVEMLESSKNVFIILFLLTSQTGLDLLINKETVYKQLKIF